MNYKLYIYEVEFVNVYFFSGKSKVQLFMYILFGYVEI